MLVSPTHFRSNMETMADDKFGKKVTHDAETHALKQFGGLVDNLRDDNINIMIYKQCHPDAMDSIFPNNWFSTHKNEYCPEGLLIIYPMKAKDRRLERNPKIINHLKEHYKYFVDLTFFEEAKEYLESTGVLIFDNINRKIYCNLSNRATPRALHEYMNIFNSYMSKPYKLVTFRAFDREGFPIYHTNVMMSVLERHIVICLESIKDPEEREMVRKECSENKEVIDISYGELYHMCCNVLCLRSKDGKPVVAMSNNAYLHYSKKNLRMIEYNYYLCISDIHTIENVGGGSIRCMLGEIFE